MILISLTKSNIEKTVVSDTLPSSNQAEFTPVNSDIIRARDKARIEHPDKDRATHARLRDSVLVLESGPTAFDSQSEYSKHDDARGEEYMKKE